MGRERTIELLSPAGNMEKLKTVFHFGADAVYLGGKGFNLRAQSSNFEDDELRQAVEYAHAINKKIYVTLNIIADNDDLDGIPGFVKYLEELGVDAVIVSDLGVMSLVRENSSLEIHVSTQASTSNWLAAKAWKDMGASRIILAREVCIDDMKKIKDRLPDVSLEVFVHGAMCMAYSGRCQLSTYMADRPSNKGLCANTCRWKYALVEEKRPGEYFPVIEEERGVHIFSSKDLCMIEHLDKILDAGVDSLKIEGRMKGILYGAITTKCYREAIKSYQTGNFKVDDSWVAEMRTYPQRDYTTGFYLGGLDKNSERRQDSGYDRSHELSAKVLERVADDEYIIEVRNRMDTGREVEIITPERGVQKCVLPAMTRVDTGEVVKVAHARLAVKVNMAVEMSEGDVIRQLIRTTKNPE